MITGDPQVATLLDGWSQQQQAYLYVDEGRD